MAFEPYAEDFRRTCEQQAEIVRQREERLKSELEKIGKG